MIFGIGGSAESSSSKSKTSGKRETTEKLEQKQTGRQTQQAKTEQQASGRFLDAETEQILQGIIGSIAASGGIEGGAASVAEEGATAAGEAIDFARFLTDRSTMTSDFVAENISPIISEARRVGEDELGRLVTQAGTAAGSNLNSFVTGIAAEGRADLESQLAALAANLTIQGRELESRDVAAASSTLQNAAAGAQLPQAQGVGQVAQLANILRGAVSETSGVSTTEAESESEQLMTALREVLETFESKTKGSADTAGGGISIGI